MKIEETLNGGYKGLYGEVVTHDCYKLKSLDFVPSLVFDIGANIGVFTRYARSLWPDAWIFAVEPHKSNIQDFIEHTHFDIRMILFQKALGKGQMWHNKGARNGSGESYVASGLGFDPKIMETADSTEKSDVETIMIPDLMKWWKEGAKTVMKIDCEGAENVIWEDEASMEALKKMDYVCMETHFYALSAGAMYDEMKEKTMEALESFKETHIVNFTHPHFEARKKWK